MCMCMLAVHVEARLSGGGASARACELRRACMCIRQMWLSGRGCPNKTIEAYFLTLDADKSGSLDVHEVSHALLSLKEAITRKAYAERISKVRGMRNAAESFERAAALVRQLQSLDAPPVPSVASRLGILLEEKSIKVEQAGWDSDGTGKIDKDEFAEAVRKLGFEATDAELKELFAEIDVDSSGPKALTEPNLSISETWRESNEPHCASSAPISTSHTFRFFYGAFRTATHPGQAPALHHSFLLAVVGQLSSG